MTSDVDEEFQANTSDEMLAILADDLGPDGFQRELDPNHSVTFISRGPQLLVTFDTYDNSLKQTHGGLPIGYDFVEDKNWSWMHISAHRQDWFRAQAVYDFFDEMVDEELFEDYENVLFYGSGLNAYAACAFSVTAPGATVMALSPQATLDATRAGWDTRFTSAKGLDFTGRFAYAPEMVEGAGQVFVLYDPYRTLDHVHASLFHGDNVTTLTCRHLNGMIEQALSSMDLLHRVIEMAANQTLTVQSFASVFRARRQHNRYLRTLMYAQDKRQKTERTALLCKYVLSQQEAPAFRKRLNAIVVQMSKTGTLPDWLADEVKDAQAVST